MPSRVGEERRGVNVKQQGAARAQAAADALQHGFRVASRHFREAAEDEGDDVEDVVEGQVPQVTVQPFDVHPGAFGPSAGGVDGGGTQVDTRDDSAALRHGDAVPAAAAGKIENAAAGNQQAVPFQERDLALRVAA